MRVIGSETAYFRRAQSNFTQVVLLAEVEAAHLAEIQIVVNRQYTTGSCLVALIRWYDMARIARTHRWHNGICTWPLSTNTLYVQLL